MPEPFVIALVVVGVVALLWWLDARALPTRRAGRPEFRGGYQAGPGRARHKRRPCVRCGLCTCPLCREQRRAGKWFAPRDGGYHGCRTEGDPMPVRPPTAVVRPVNIGTTDPDVDEEA